MTKKYLTLAGIVLSSGLLASPLYARLHGWFEEPFFEEDWFEEVIDAHAKAMDTMRKSFADRGPSKEAREAIKSARRQLSKITHEVQEDDEKVTITFSGFDNLTKDDVKVVKKTTGWFGTIMTPVGRIEFFISPRGLQVSSQLEVKRERKASAPETDKEALTKEEKEPAASELFYTSSSLTETRSFTSAVDLTTLEAKPVQSGTFILTVNKQKEIVLPIS